MIDRGVEQLVSVGVPFIQRKRFKPNPRALKVWTITADTHYVKK